MRLVFDHTHGFGKMTRQNISYVPFAAVVEPSEYKECLETGWFPFNEDIWFQTRSTRIDLKLYKPDSRILKLAKKVKYFPDVNMTKDKRARLKTIYEKYIQRKNYKYDLSIDEIIANSHGHIYYVYNNEIIAFSFNKIVGDSLLGVEFAWDYAEPKLSMGHINVYYNTIYAKFNRCKYFYLSSGYESCSIYKSSYPGFQWWTGQSWTDDVETYKELCRRDDRLQIQCDGFI
jgi:hypothetical protein